jgi:hypothetical protein
MKYKSTIGKQYHNQVVSGILMPENDFINYSKVKFNHQELPK